MKTRLTAAYLVASVLMGNAFAAGWTTNDVDQAKAVEVASLLWAGMSERDLVRVVERENGLRCTLIHGIRGVDHWTRCYTLRDGSSLNLESRQEHNNTNRWLIAASVRSNGVYLAYIRFGITEAEQELLGAFFRPAPEVSETATNYIVVGTTSSERAYGKASRLRSAADQMDADSPLREAIEDLIRKSRVDLRVQLRTNPAARVAVLSEEDIDARLKCGVNAYWNQLFLDFPGAKSLYRVSRIGFDTNGTVAILDIQEGSGGLAGRTHFEILRRKNGQWRRTNEHILLMEDVWH